MYVKFTIAACCSFLASRIEQSILDYTLSVSEIIIYFEF